MVDHEREVLVLALPADLVDADLVEIVQPAGIELGIAHALDDPPDRVPVDPQHPLDRRLVRPGRQPGVRVEPGRVAALSGDCFPGPLPRTGYVEFHVTGFERSERAERLQTVATP